MTTETQDATLSAYEGLSGSMPAVDGPAALKLYKDERWYVPVRRNRTMERQHDEWRVGQVLVRTE